MIIEHNAESNCTKKKKKKTCYWNILEHSAVKFDGFLVLRNVIHTFLCPIPQNARIKLQISSLHQSRRSLLFNNSPSHAFSYLNETSQTMNVNILRHNSFVQLIPHMFFLAVLRINPKYSFCLNPEIHNRTNENMVFYI